MYRQVYRVKNMSEAMNKIKQDMGPNAEVVSEKRVFQKGTLGFLKAKEFEITAVISQDERERFLRKKQSKEKGFIGNDMDVAEIMEGLAGKQPLAEPKNFTQKNEAKTTKAPTNQSKGGGEATKKATKNAPATTKANANAKANTPTSANNVAPTTPETSTTPAPIMATEPSIMQLNSDIKELKGMLADFIAKGVQPKTVTDVYKEAKTNFENLMEQYDFTKYVKEEFASFLKAHEVGLNEANAEWVEKFVEEAIDQVFEVDEEPKSKVRLLVGPPGVGKTTTIAKMASIEKKYNKKKVGFITVDEFRIGAVEQLRIYASILQAPIEVVSTKEKLEEALVKLSDCDLIIVDSIGRSHRDENNLIELADLLGTLQTEDVYLVLSASSKQSELFKIMDEFESFNYNKVVLTKLDENEHNEIILNIAMERDYPFSYFCTGQKVPKHIEKATKERAVKFILGERGTE